MYMEKRGQISMEYLIVVSFVVFVVIVLVGVAVFYTSGARDRLKSNQLANFANKLVTSAESVYFAGEPSRVTITAHMPEGVTNLAIADNSFVFTFETSGGTNVIAYSSDAPLNAGISISTNEGVKRLRIEASSDNSVHINEV